MSEENEEIELVLKLNLDMKIQGLDNELDCMECLAQVMQHYQEIIDQDEMDRIAVWFGGKYND